MCVAAVQVVTVVLSNTPLVTWRLKEKGKIVKLFSLILLCIFFFHKICMQPPILLRYCSACSSKAKHELSSRGHMEITAGPS